MSDQRNAAALTEILARAQTGRLTADRETLPLDLGTEARSRDGKSSYRRGVLIS